MSKKSPDHIDAHVGERIRARRIALGMSQQALAEELGLTFQQVQKYEKGVNRVGAGRLHVIGQILDVSIEFFFEGLEMGKSKGRAGAGFESLLDSVEGVRLARAFGVIRDDAVKKKIVELLEALSAGKKTRRGS